MWGHPRQTGHGGEVWQKVVHWRREWQTTLAFLPREPMNSMKSQKDRNVQLFVTSWTVGAYHAPLSMGFSRQEYWSGLPLPNCYKIALAASSLLSQLESKIFAGQISHCLWISILFPPYPNVRGSWKITNKCLNEQIKILEFLSYSLYLRGTPGSTFHDFVPIFGNFIWLELFRLLVCVCVCVCVCVLVTQSCPTLCGPMDCSPPGSSVHGISQARTLEWVAISFSRGSSWPRDPPAFPAHLRMRPVSRCPQGADGLGSKRV